jgi:omega-6 fatty acid desaturase (delta-12 desaturase)
MEKEKTFDLKQLLQFTRAYAIEDTRRSWRELFVTVLFTFTCFFFTQVSFHWIIRSLAVVFCGFALTRSFILYHDVIHGAIFRDSKVGSFICKVIGFIVLRPPAEWRRSHDFHHLHNTQIKTSHIGSFPLYTYDDFKKLPLTQKLVYKFARSPFVILLGYFFVFAFESIKKLFFKDSELRFQSAIAILLHSLIIFTLHRFGGWQAVVWSFILPMTLACILGSYLFYVQHNFEGAELRTDDSWDYAQSAMVSSSCLKAPKTLHWLTGNIGYHHIHHLNPKVPFYNLPKAMAEVPAFQNPTFVSLSPKNIIHSLKLKLWSPEHKQWVDFNGKEISRQTS